MGTNNLIYLEVLEWFDETGQELVHRLPEKGSGEIKFSTAAPAHKDDIMVPFWRISAKISPINLSSHADLARMANLPIAIPREWEKNLCISGVRRLRFGPTFFYGCWVN